jgi:hypothetical protein
VKREQKVDNEAPATGNSIVDPFSFFDFVSVCEKFFAYLPWQHWDWRSL